MDNKKIGKLIAMLRKQKGLTQQELGDKVGVGSRAVSKWECGTTVPDISIINELSTILGISSDELLSGKLNKPKETKPKSKLKTKYKILIISAIILIISLISLFIYNNNKTYVYNIAETEPEKFKIEGNVTYQNGIISIYINNFIFDKQLTKLNIKQYKYEVKLNNKMILGYGQTVDDNNAYKNYTIKDIENLLKINYTGKTNLSPKELLEKRIYIKLTLWDVDRKEFHYEIGMSLCKVEK